MTFSTMPHRIIGLSATLSINDTQHKQTQLSSIECHYAVSRFFAMLSVVMLNVVMQNVVAPLMNLLHNFYTISAGEGSCLS
jgi:hypothetical protein